MRRSAAWRMSAAACENTWARTRLVVKQAAARNPSARMDACCSASERASRGVAVSRRFLISAVSLSVAPAAAASATVQRPWGLSPLPSKPLGRAFKYCVTSWAPWATTRSVGPYTREGDGEVRPNARCAWALPWPLRSAYGGVSGGGVPFGVLECVGWAALRPKLSVWSEFEFWALVASAGGSAGGS